MGYLSQVAQKMLDELHADEELRQEPDHPPRTMYVYDDEFTGMLSIQFPGGGMTECFRPHVQPFSAHRHPIHPLDHD